MDFKTDIKKYAAEFIGTLILSLAVTFSLAGHFPVPTPVIAGLALGAGVYSMGGISGAHFNPAITLGLLSIQKISLKDAGFYILAQLLGAAAALQISPWLVVPATLPALNNSMVFVSEGLGAFVFAFGVASVAHGKVSQGASGLMVGGSLLLGISLAAGSNGVLNPAVALAIGSFSLSYMFAPIIGAIFAMMTYRFLSN